MLEKIVQTNKPLLIIADDIDQEVVETLGSEQTARHVQRCLHEGAKLRRQPESNAGRYRDCNRRKVFLKDLAMELKDGEIEDLGHANRVVVKKVTRPLSAVPAIRQN